MRSTTQVCIGIKHVGESGSPAEFFDGTIIDSWLAAFEYITKRSMAKRFDLVVCRNRSDAIVALNRTYGRGASQVEESQVDQMSQMLARLKAMNSNQDFDSHDGDSETDL